MYEASNFGNIRNAYTKRVMKLCPSEKGYMMTIFRCIDNKSRCIKIHRIIAWIFVTGYDQLHNEVNHKDGDKTNNHAYNLEWSTRKENIRHGFEHSLIPHMTGQMNGMSKLTDDDVHEICRLLVQFNGKCALVYKHMLNSGMNYVTRHMVYDIKYKKTGVRISDLYFVKNQFDEC